MDIAALFLSVAVAATDSPVTDAADLLQDAALPVTSVTISGEGKELALATDVVTPFGRSVVRAPEYVVSGPSWSKRTLHPRAALALTDMNFATSDEEAHEGPLEAAVMFARGFSEMIAGPDVFFFDRYGEAEGVRICPIYRMPNDSLVEGEPVVLQRDVHYGVTEVAGRKVFGVGVDLDQWIVAGLMPDDARIVGALIRHDGEGATAAPLKVMMAQHALFSEFDPRRDNIPTYSNAMAYNSGGVRASAGRRGGGGGSPLDDDMVDDPDDPEVPAPGAALLFALAGGHAALRRERRT